MSLLDAVRYGLRSALDYERSNRKYRRDSRPYTGPVERLTMNFRNDPPGFFLHRTPIECLTPSKLPLTVGSPIRVVSNNFAKTSVSDGGWFRMGCVCGTVQTIEGSPEAVARWREQAERVYQPGWPFNQEPAS